MITKVNHLVAVLVLIITFLIPSIILASDNVLATQKKLNELGFNAGAVDGIWGNTTKNALIEYLSTKGLKFDGSLDNNEFKMLDIPLIKVFTVKNPSKFSVPSAYKRLLEIGFNDPKQGHRQELVVADNVPEHAKTLYRNIQKNLNKVIGGYPNYVQLIFDDDEPNTNNTLILERLRELKYDSVDWTWSKKDGQSLKKNCLAAADPGGSRSPFTTPHGICLQPMSRINDPFDSGGPIWKKQSRLALNWAHEYFHHYQRAMGLERGLDYQSGSGSVDAPMWWVEGAAVAFQKAWFKENWKDIPELKSKSWQQLKGISISRDYTDERLYKKVRKALQGKSGNYKDCHKDWMLSSDQRRYDSGDKCIAKFLAVPFMAYKSSYKTVWIDIPKDYYSIGFWGAVEKNLGLTEKEFYAEFNSFMRSGNVGSNPPKGWKPRHQEISKYANFLN